MPEPVRAALNLALALFYIVRQEAHMSISRVVALLTPVFAGLSGWAATLAAQYLPGHPTLDETALTAVFIAGATAAGGIAWKWLDGLSKHERGVTSR